MTRRFDFDEPIDRREVAALKYNGASMKRIFVALTRDYLSRHVPAARIIEPEGTFLLWLDLRELGLDVEALQHFLVHDARLGLNMGHWFGREGAGFARRNIACPRASLEKALGQLATAVAALPADAGR